jgi:hypothetical protein
MVAQFRNSKVYMLIKAQARIFLRIKIKVIKREINNIDIK